MTRLFAVRTVETHMPVGFYFADSVDHLSCMVDDEISPTYCEYHPITAASAIIWPGDVDWKMGVAQPDLDLEKVKRWMKFKYQMEGFVDGGSDIDGWKQLMKPR